MAQRSHWLVTDSNVKKLKMADLHIAMTHQERAIAIVVHTHSGRSWPQNNGRDRPRQLNEHRSRAALLLLPF